MEDPEEPQGTHFWHMCFLVHNSRGFVAEERAGHWTPPQGMTRFDAMQVIRGRVVEASPDLENSALLSFDIQLNQI
ncbi:hypothetical protein [Streptomyces sp. TS71-3]|uniref:hypothetical protein n=1 Tax=Streptomyces sp. TS71-3 TaxID=2733862 RepID=UPI001B10FB76|nr:hypothetical protein [Streptomyces sp. TS71-3]GHJ35520.1 hypothetical protein Sm713_11290 [Streptomyces sp. TS71-3]